MATQTTAEATTAPGVGEPIKGKPAEAEGAAETQETTEATEAQPDQSAALTQRLRQSAIEIARRDRELATLRKQVEDLSGKGKLSEEQEAKFKKDALALLEHYGHTFDRVAQQVVEGEAKPQSAEERAKAEHERQLQERIDKLEAAHKEAAERERTVAQQQARAQRLANVKSYVDQSEDLSTVATLGFHEQVLNRIEAYEQERGGISNEEAAQIIHDYEQDTRKTITSQVKELVRLPWARELLAAAMKQAATADGQQEDESGTEAEPEVQPADKPDRTARRGRKPTVTNAKAAEAGTPDKRPLSRSERIARAAAKVREQRAAGR